MVKLGNNFSDKNNAKTVSEDGFDTIPLITPLDASQLQFPALDKVVVKTKTDYDGGNKKSRLRSPKIAEFSISIIEGVSERLKVRHVTFFFFTLAPQPLDYFNCCHGNGLLMVLSHSVHSGKFLSFFTNWSFDQSDQLCKRADVKRSDVIGQKTNLVVENTNLVAKIRIGLPV
uniref:Neuronal vesicle trafficking-associated protein 1 n=1 Tax=Salmo trutta TaxID=8032 RepID=A0A674EFA2_SALTR